MILALHRRHPLTLLGASAGFLGLSVLLIIGHVRATDEVRQDALPLAGQASALLRRGDVLQAQIDAAQIQTALTAGSLRERLAADVLPNPSSNDRLLSLLSLASDTLQRSGVQRSSSPIVFGPSRPEVVHGETLTTQTVTFSVTVNQEGVSAWTTLVDLMGYVTVADALAPADVQLLTATTEQQDPAAIDALQHFLNLDLSAYALNAAAERDRLLATFTTDAFRARLDAVLAAPTLREAMQFFPSDLGRAIADQKLWPLPLVTLRTLSVQPADHDMQTASFVLERYGRKAR